MLYIAHFIILDCRSIKKISFGNFLFELPRNCISKVFAKFSISDL